jgi:hypothetical protein
MARICEEAHCHSQEVLDVCKEVYGENNYASKPVASRDSMGACKCTCSCLAFDTPVADSLTSMRAIQEFKGRSESEPGDFVLAAGSNLQWTQKEVFFSGGTSRGAKQPNAILVEYGNDFIVTTADHLFLMPDGKLKMANRLSVRDQLVQPDGQTVQVTSVRMGDYYSGFHHIATSKGDPRGNLDDHLLNTNGVVTADYAVQLFSDEFLDQTHNDLPEVGTAAYEEVYGSPQKTNPHDLLAGDRIISGRNGLAPLSPQTVSPGRTEMAFLSTAALSGKPIFVPAEETKVVIPPNACGFISDNEARILALQPKRSMANLIPLDDANGLVDHFHSFYPDVVYHVDWADETVNAYAWVDNGTRNIALKGGLLRHPAIQLEATALVIAHELGHHYGGQPTFPQGLSCEGRADYYGANIIMRRVWFGDFYLRMMEPAVQQLSNFFQPNPGNHGCEHPSRDCRTSIYNAAIELRPIPACAFAS